MIIEFFLFFIVFCYGDETYTRNDIKCLTYSQSYQYLCDLDILYPNYISCHDDNDTTFIHCVSDKTWIMNIQRVCNENEICFVSFDAFASIIYVSIMLFGTILIFCFIGCLIITVYITHCFFKYESGNQSLLEKGFCGLKRKKIVHIV